MPPFGPIPSTWRRERIGMRTALRVLVVPGATRKPHGGAGTETPGASDEDAADESDPFVPEPSTRDRLRALRAAGEMLDGTVRQARRLRSGLRRAVDAEHPAAKCLVLVADDTEDTRELYAQALREAGFRVLQAVDGCEAFEKAAAWLPDVIVIDYAMPRMDGAEAVQKLAREQHTMHIPVVMISAYADELPDRVTRSCTVCLSKPCDAEDLVRVVRLALDARALGV